MDDRFGRPSCCVKDANKQEDNDIHGWYRGRTTTIRNISVDPPHAGTPTEKFRRCSTAAPAPRDRPLPPLPMPLRGEQPLLLILPWTPGAHGVLGAFRVLPAHPLPNSGTRRSKAPNLLVPHRTPPARNGTSARSGHAAPVYRAYYTRAATDRTGRPPERADSGTMKPVARRMTGTSPHGVRVPTRRKHTMSSARAASLSRPRSPHAYLIISRSYQAITARTYPYPSAPHAIWVASSAQRASRRGATLFVRRGRCRALCHHPAVQPQQPPHLLTVDDAPIAEASSGPDAPIPVRGMRVN